MSKPMTKKEFRTLKRRDFENGAVLDEIDEALSQLERLAPVIESVQRYVKDPTGYYFDLLKGAARDAGLLEEK